MNDLTNSTPAAERHQDLWMLTISPSIWAVHFLASYLTAAIWCAKIGGELSTVRILITIYTVVALATIVFTGWRGCRRHAHAGGPRTHDDDTPEDRHSFLGFATLLLSGLSFVAVAYAALVIIYFRSCI